MNAELEVSSSKWTFTMKISYICTKCIELINKYRTKVHLFHFTFLFWTAWRVAQRWGFQKMLN